ncbi:hypothetical protein [uncultured Halopseudomonas sp.]|uniref:alpha/beta hydrolase family protein n=1 Tax=uncultured Halopseudomonas sp. TaxID=2901193 RepID=UPI0030EBD123|tara:strand:+ start:36881 stop:37933 length:1053 start_codon:yes stop_codon:yes gene_type:complete
MSVHRQFSQYLAGAILLIAHSLASASIGLLEIQSPELQGPITVLYPSEGAETEIERAGFKFNVAHEAYAIEGNRRLIVISHGSAASPWVHFELAHDLVEAGFVVALPEHFQDNYRDTSASGPESWKQRPAEISRTIDAIARDPQLSIILGLQRVGMYGMSAGGHTALTLAGGRWSPGQFVRHCEEYIEDDFQACVGLSTELTGGVFDGAKTAMAKWVIGNRFSDQTWYEHTDPRIVAIVAGVPFAADFDLESLKTPNVPLGLIVADQDKWLTPAFHSDRVIDACTSCQVLMSIENGGHGALLAPLPLLEEGLTTELIGDPPGYARSEVTDEVSRVITSFFQTNLAVGPDE